MDDNNFILLKRECEGVLIPSGDPVVLPKKTKVKITQSLGGYFTLYVNGNLIKLNGNYADALGYKIKKDDGKRFTGEYNEEEIWERLKTCYDPEIPVNIVELGLIYDLKAEKKDNNQYIISIKMTLTAPGCGMGPSIAQDVENKVNSLSYVSNVEVELVWEPQWNQDMMTEEAKLQLGML